MVIPEPQGKSRPLLKATFLEPRELAEVAAEPDLKGEIRIADIVAQVVPDGIAMEGPEGNTEIISAEAGLLDLLVGEPTTI
jgi:hypothetical protein